MITGQEKPDAGTLRVGDTVQIGYVDQSRDALDANKTVFEEISGGTTRSMLGKAQGRLARLRVVVQLQGPRPAAQGRRALRRRTQPRPPGEAARSGGNLLLLDEPTNDLDVDTLRALEEALLNFGGCAVVISHDRWFLDRIATHILAFEGDSKVVWFEGNYQDYEPTAKRRLGAAADQPHRIKYRKLNHGDQGEQTPDTILQVAKARLQGESTRCRALLFLVEPHVRTSTSQMERPTRA